ncbi:hypothetical protein CN383_26840 [Priestia megaterium]|nr:hypothetical protein CN383_26840 [Priestia megaterium]
MVIIRTIFNFLGGDFLMKNRDKRRKKKRDFFKDYLKNKLENWKPKLGKEPTSNMKDPKDQNKDFT